MTGKEILTIVLVIAAIPALFMLLVGILGGRGRENRR